MVWTVFSPALNNVDAVTVMVVILTRNPRVIWEEPTLLLGYPCPLSTFKHIMHINELI